MSKPTVAFFGATGGSVAACLALALQAGLGQAGFLAANFGDGLGAGFDFVASPLRRTRETMERIVQAHFPDIRRDLAREALNVFFQVRGVNELKKKPATSELLDWLKLILAEDLAPEDLRRDPHKMLPKLHGALLKNEQDVHL